MTLLGWLFMLASAALVWGMTIWCYYKVLTAPVPPPEEVKHFHNA